MHVVQLRRGVERPPSPLQKEIVFDTPAKRSHSAPSREGTPSPLSVSPPSSPDTTQSHAFIITEGDLFDHPDCDAFVHCVSADLAMGRGFAKTVAEKFGALQTICHATGATETYSLCHPDCTAWPVEKEVSIGTVVVQDLGEDSSPRYILHVVTKLRYFHKPTMETFRRAVETLAGVCEKLNIRKVHMPDIGTGLDKLPHALTRDAVKTALCNTCDVVLFLYTPAPLRFVAGRSTSE